MSITFIGIMYFLPKDFSINSVFKAFDTKLTKCFLYF